MKPDQHKIDEAVKLFDQGKNHGDHLTDFVKTVQADVKDMKPAERKAFFDELDSALRNPEHLKSKGHMPECKIVDVTKDGILEQGEKHGVKGSFLIDEHGKQQWHKAEHEEHAVHNKMWGGKQFHVQVDGNDATYNVKNGDTPFSIAKAALSRDGKHHDNNEVVAEAKKIAEANHLKPNESLHAGKIITIPGAGDLVAHTPARHHEGHRATEQVPTSQMPVEQVPPGQMRPGQMPVEQMPPGQIQAGMPMEQMPPGQMPPYQNQMMPGQIPMEQMPPGQILPGQVLPELAIQIQLQPEVRIPQERIVREEIVVEHTHPERHRRKR